MKIGELSDVDLEAELELTHRAVHEYNAGAEKLEKHLLELQSELVKRRMSRRG